VSSIPSNLSRMPNLLRSAMSLRTITTTNLEMLRVQQQIASGLDLLRPSDDIVRAAAVGVLDDRLDRSAQIRRNLSHADSALGTLDGLLGEAHAAVLSARGIAAAQMTATSSPQERASQAIVIDQILAGMFNTANREGVAGYALGGSQTTRAPIAAFLAGYRYMGDGPGLMTDLGMTSGVPITLGQGNPLTSLSSRVRGGVDLDPDLTADTRLADLGGARGTGVSGGSMTIVIDGGTPLTVDLTDADTTADVIARVTAAIRQYESDNSVAVLGPGAVGTAGEAFTLDVAAGRTVEFREVGSGTAARDLGLTADTPFVFSPTVSTGVDLLPRLTWRTPITALGGVTGALGQVRIANAGRTTVVDLSTATTLGDLRNLIEGANLGLRVAINEDGDGIDVLNEVSSSSANALYISEVGGSNGTAGRLGIRTLNTDTRLADFNFGRGVQIVDGQNDPTTNLPSPSLNVDMRVTLGDSAGTAIDIDLRPQDMATVQTLLDRINAEIAAGLASAGLPAGSLSASLHPTDNGLVLTQDTAFPNPLRIEPRNNSPASEQLGLLGGTYDAGSATLTGQDRAKVRVESVFTYLLDLREALRGNDVPGIALAAESLEGAADRLVDTRGLVGGFAQRIDAAMEREADRMVLDEATRSNLRDTDFARAASRFALLQTQLQAAMQVTAAASSRSLLDFLG
jgi:flagellar hook-associated protein 3 FlgL